MHIYIYTLRFNPKTGGGSHHSLEIFIRALIACGHTPVLSTFHSSDNNYAQKPCEMREENFSGGFIALQKHIAQLMRENTDAGVHHLYGPTVMWAGGIFKQKGGKTPVVVSLNNYTPGMGLHHPPPFACGNAMRAMDMLIRKIHRAKWYLWEKFAGVQLAKKIDRFYFDSPVIQEQYRKFGYSAISSVVLPAPMEKTAEADLPPPFRRDEKIFNILFAGRLIADKGPDLLVKATLQLPKDIHVHFIGTGNEETNLKKFVRDNGLKERVFFHGWKKLEELSSFYKNADVFIQPSRWPEPFGRTTADAMACGLPVIATENSGPAWVAGDGGLTFKKDSVEDLVRCILFYLNNPEERASYAKRSIARARLFDADTVSRQFVTDIESLVSQ